MIHHLHPPLFTCSVPATTANLGPGFDAFGLAVDLRNSCTVRASEIPGITLTVRGYGADQVPKDETNLTAQAIIAIYETFGRPAPSLHLDVQQNVPFGRGLGSSATAVVLGIGVAKALIEPTVLVSNRRLLSVAAAMDGHPDNVAACLFGGLTITWGTSAGASNYRVATPHPNLRAALGVPDRQLVTAQSRGLLPDQIAHVAAADNSSRAALLFWGLQNDLSVLFEATEDRLHQQYRAEAMPETMAAVAALRSRGFAAVVSGAGPSFLVLSDGEPDTAQIAATVSGQWELLTPEVTSQGLLIERPQGS